MKGSRNLCWFCIFDGHNHEKENLISDPNWRLDCGLQELKEKEGIESVDDILREVISSGGMSFNKIKPVYRYGGYKEGIEVLGSTMVFWKIKLIFF